MSEAVAVNNVGGEKIAGTYGDPPVGRKSKKPKIVQRRRFLEMFLERKEASAHHDLVNQNHGRRLNDNEKDALLTYSGDSHHLNRQLWNGHFDHPAYERQAKAIDSALSKNRLHRSIHVYSGTDRAPKETHHHLPFLSTSLDKEQAHRFTKEDDKGHRHVLKIALKPGQRGTYMHGIAHHTMKDEKEYLLPRNMKLKKTGEETKEHNGKTYVYHHMEVHS